MRPIIRFHPPDLPIPPGVNWALLRAFGPVGAAVTDTDAPEDRLNAANRLGLLPRISARQSNETLSDELGTDTARTLTQRRLTQTAKGLALLDAQRKISEVVESRNLPIVFLKFAALCTKGIVTPSSRAACDLDLLVRPDDTAQVIEALKTIGFVKSDLVVPEHHPSILSRVDGVVIELHVHLPYVRTVLGGRHARLDDLADALLLTPASETSTSVKVPIDELLTAHLIAHGLAQHGFTPKTYSLLRMVSDLIDLGLPENEALALDAFRWIQTDVTYAEFSALLQLLGVLKHSYHTKIWAQDEPVSMLLRHFVLGALDPKYQARVILRLYLRAFEEDGVRETLRRLAIFTFCLPYANLRKIYPSTKSSLGLRLARPFDFAWRGIKMVSRAVTKRR